MRTQLIDSTVESRKSSWLTSPFSAGIIEFNTGIGYWVSKAIGFGLRMKRQVLVTPTDIDGKHVYVLASNHQCRLDPFVIIGALPYSVWGKLGTVRYMVYRPLFDIPLLGPFLLGLGCFPATEHPKHPFGLVYAKGQMAQGRSISIFPEGRRVIRGEREARRGVAVLAQEPNALLLPAHIEWRRRGWWHGFGVTIGKPIDASKMTAQEILDYIYALPVGGKR